MLKNSQEYFFIANILTTSINVSVEQFRLSGKTSEDISNNNACFSDVSKPRPLKQTLPLCL